MKLRNETIRSLETKLEEKQRSRIIVILSSFEKAKKKKEN